MENHYYNAFTRLYGTPAPEDNFVVLNRLRAKSPLHSVPLQKVLVDTDEHDWQRDEQPTLFHVLRMQKRRSTRVIRQIQDEEGLTQNTHIRIISVFVAYLRKKYNTIEMDDSCINATANAILHPPDLNYMEHLKRQIDVDEIRRALLAGSRRKTPGSEGLSLEFYKAHLTTIRNDLHAVLNQVYLNKTITPQQKHGVISCMPKHGANAGRIPADHIAQR